MHASWVCYIFLSLQYSCYVRLSFVWSFISILISFFLKSGEKVLVFSKWHIHLDLTCAFLLFCRSQTGNGAGCLCDDCREGGEALPHDDDQESAPDQGQTQETKHCAQVLHGKVSFLLPQCLASLGSKNVTALLCCSQGDPYKLLLHKISRFSKELGSSLPKSWQNAQSVLPLHAYSQ